ncbi:uroporphyrinogen-III C-methyltransferase [Limoniibacter endophyticus]|nr:uroporphyrinogen-III C-methyltransferase [Limoniibacter endophyticus]
MSAPLIDHIARTMPDFMPGHVWLAGAGPGDPRHLTLEVVAALSQADVIVHDALVDASVLDLAPQAQKIFAGKRGGQPSTAQDEIIDRLIALARQDLRVLRLKGGDPFIFGRGGEEAEALATEGISFRVLPGLTSALAALANANIPATMRGINKAVTFATGHAAGTADDLDWSRLAAADQPIIVYMGMKALPTIVEELRAGGAAADLPVAIIMAATTGKERVLTGTLATIVTEAIREKIGSPALIVIGEIVSMRARLCRASI